MHTFSSWIMKIAYFIKCKTNISTDLWSNHMIYKKIIWMGKMWSILFIYCCRASQLPRIPHLLKADYQEVSPSPNIKITQAILKMVFSSSHSTWQNYSYFKICILLLNKNWMVFQIHFIHSLIWLFYLFRIIFFLFLFTLVA